MPASLPRQQDGAPPPAPTGSAASAGAASRRPGNRVALFGDSILHLDAVRDDSGNVATGSYGSYWGGSILQHANTLLGRRFTVSDDFAVPGNTTTQMVARLGDVLASTADVVVMMGGTNDLLGTGPASTITANFQAIYDAILGAGKTLVHCTILPSDSYTSTAQKTARATANRWILQQANTHPGLIVVPWDGDLTAGATGGTIAGSTVDGVHPGTLGGLLLGRALAPVLGTLFPDRGNGWLPSSNADPFNGLPNGVMLGSNTATGTNVSGVVADNRTLYGNSHTGIAGAKVARTDGKPGEWLEVSYTGLTAPTGGDDTANCGIYTGLPAAFLGTGGYVATSTKTFAAVELSTTNFAAATAFYIQLLYIAAGNVVGATFAYRPNNFNTDTKWIDFAGTVYLPLVKVPAGTDTVVLNVQASAANGQTVKVRIGRNGVYFL